MTSYSNICGWLCGGIATFEDLSCREFRSIFSLRAIVTWTGTATSGCTTQSVAITLRGDEPRGGLILSSGSIMIGDWRRLQISGSQSLTTGKSPTTGKISTAQSAGTLAASSMPRRQLRADSDWTTNRQQVEDFRNVGIRHVDAASRLCSTNRCWIDCSVDSNVVSETQPVFP